MEKKYTDRAGNKITAAQFITELILIRRAHKDKKILPIEFWKIDSYKKWYQINIIYITRFLKQYNPDDVIRVLVRENSVYSIRHPKLKKWIVEEQKNREEFETMTKNTYDVVTNPIVPKKQISKLITDLRALDG